MSPCPRQRCASTCNLPCRRLLFPRTGPSCSENSRGTNGDPRGLCLVQVYVLNDVLHHCKQKATADGGDGLAAQAIIRY